MEPRPSDTVILAYLVTDAELRQLDDMADFTDAELLQWREAVGAMGVAASWAKFNWPNLQFVGLSLHLRELTARIGQSGESEQGLTVPDFAKRHMAIPHELFDAADISLQCLRSSLRTWIDKRHPGSEFAAVVVGFGDHKAEPWRHHVTIPF